MPRPTSDMSVFGGVRHALAGVFSVEGVLVCYGVLVFWCKPHRLQHQGAHPLLHLVRSERRASSPPDVCGGVRKCSSWGFNVDGVLICFGVLV